MVSNERRVVSREPRALRARPHALRVRRRPSPVEPRESPALPRAVLLRPRVIRGFPCLGRSDPQVIRPHPRAPRACPQVARPIPRVDSPAHRDVRLEPRAARAQPACRYGAPTSGSRARDRRALRGAKTPSASSPDGRPRWPISREFGASSAPTRREAGFTREFSGNESSGFCYSAPLNFSPSTGWTGATARLPWRRRPAPAGVHAAIHHEKREPSCLRPRPMTP